MRATNGKNCNAMQHEEMLIAARAVAKRLVEELKAMPWHRKGNAEECSQRVSESVQQASRKYGISPLLIKSMMMRIQDGRA